MTKEALGEIDKQIVSWVEQLDEAYKERAHVNWRIVEIEQRLSAMKTARRALALEWKDDSQEVMIPLQYTCEGVRETIHEVLSKTNKTQTVDQIVSRLNNLGYNFGKKNPRRVVNMALINDPDVESDGMGGYTMGEPPFGI